MLCHTLGGATVPLCHGLAGWTGAVIALLRFLLLLRRPGPPHDDLVLPRRVPPEGLRPLPHQDADVPLLFRALLVPLSHSATRVRGVLRSDGHAVQAEHRAMLSDVRARDIVILFERHLLIKPHGGLVHDEEVSQDEVVSALLVVPEGPRAAAQRVDAGQLRRLPVLGVCRQGAELREHEARGGDRRQNVTFGGFVRCVGRVVALLGGLRAVAVLPTRDVVRDLDASLAAGGGILESHVPGRGQFATDHGFQTKFFVVTQARLIHVPRRLDADGDEGGLHHGDVSEALRLACAPCRNNRHVQVRGGRKESAFLRRQNFEERIVAADGRRPILNHFELSFSERTLVAIVGAELPPCQLFNHVLVEEAFTARTDVRDQHPSRGAEAAAVWSRRFHSLAPIVGQPGAAPEIHHHVRKLLQPLLQGEAPLERRTWAPVLGDLVRRVQGRSLKVHLPSSLGPHLLDQCRTDAPAATSDDLLLLLRTGGSRLGRHGAETN
mmetsp:Transcript_95315/g.273305  ORF Transcript_95315/g.273305 Transcript_95315/m.273305 type:complete len:494 (+) Transcript_95315:132-1613(+)